MLVLQKIDKVINWISTGLSFIGAIWIFAIMIIIVVDVITRISGGHIEGTVEIVRNSIVGIAFFMIPLAMVQKRHVRTSIIVDRVSPTGRRILNIIAYLIGIVIFICICISGWGLFMTALQNGEFELSGNFRFYTWPIRLIIIVGSALTCWHCLILLLEEITGKPISPQSIKEAKEKEEEKKLAEQAAAEEVIE